MRCLEFRHVSHEVSTQVINELPNRLYNCSNIQIDRHVMYRFFTWFLPLFLFGVAGNFIWGNNTTDQVQQLRITTRQKQWPTPTTQQPKTSNRQPSIIVIIIITTINKINISTTSTSTSTPISATTARRRRSRRVQRTGAKGRYNHEGTNAGNNCPSRQKEHRPKAPIFPSMFSEIHLYYCIPRITTAEGNEQKYRHIILRNIPTYLDSNRYRHI